jgi:hypothetical protein
VLCATANFAEKEFLEVSPNVLKIEKKKNLQIDYLSGE